MPLQRRLPKYGFKNINRVEYKAINLGDIQAVASEKNLDAVDVNVLVSAGMASPKDLIKVLGDVRKGQLTSKLTVSAHAFSNSAKSAIEALGGTIVILEK
jgi:large subunit ribosomal protein L15